jgi:thiamine-phosphate pyrophosphorylase
MENSIYRIIDVNFNRSREACRMIEEFCRFSLNSKVLTDRTKAIRHKICENINKLDTGKLIANRDTDTDVGAARQIDEQMQRNCLRDSFTAACKRLTEALRVLTEMTTSFDKHVSGQMEELRFRAYALEKEIALFADTASKFDKVRLYVLITSEDPMEIIDLTNKCIDGGADCIQLRAKQMPGDQMYAAANAMVELCKEAGVISIVNDRTDIAIAAGADGVHLGQNDLSVEQAGKLALSPLIIGKSTHNPDQLKEAILELPTYIGLGSVFSTGTKPDAEPVGLDYIKKAVSTLQNSGIKHVAIGGITTDNIESVLKAGARAVAVCSAVTESENPVQACKAIKQQINRYFS